MSSQHRGTDTIRLTGLTATGHHGVFEFEKRQGQPFRVDALLELDLRPAGHSDALGSTVSYAEVAALIEWAVTGLRFDLIEALAQRICLEILRHDSRISAAEVTVHKPQAPVEQRFEDISVTVRRTPADLQMESSAELGSPRPRLSGVYEAELVDDAGPPSGYPATADEYPEPGSYVTETAQLGGYETVSLQDLADSTAPLAGPDGADDGGQPGQPSGAGSDAAAVPAAEPGIGAIRSTNAPPAGPSASGVPGGRTAASPVQLRDPELPADFPVRSVLALGSNLGDSRHLLASAVGALEGADGVAVMRASPLASTKPVGGPEEQRDYLNQVVEVETSLSPHALLDLAQRIEAEHNRVREERWGPRTLDVDIVTYAGAVVDSPRLQVPHPSARERAFVLMPWSWMDPIALLDGQPVRELAARAEDAGDVVRVGEAPRSTGRFPPDPEPTEPRRGPAS